jgi:hypothetical protein
VVVGVGTNVDVNDHDSVLLTVSVDKGSVRGVTVNDCDIDVEREVVVYDTRVLVLWCAI